MKERDTFVPPVYLDAYQKPAADIETSALTAVEEQFGSGYPHYRGGQPGRVLAYHNRHHSEAVRDNTARMGEALGLEPVSLAIGKAAAAAHDIVQIKPRGVMEQESADWLEQEMRQSGRFTAAGRRAGALAILGTEPVFEDGRLAGQMADYLEYPSKEAERIARSVACADLGELHAPAGPLLGRDLYKEIRGMSPEETPAIDDRLVEFQRSQGQLASEYSYPHPQGEQVFGTLRPQITAYNASVLAQLERGDIETWDQLVAQDTAFMRQHS